MIAYADSSALVKLYVDEDGHEVVRSLATVAIGQLARVEVPAAFWRKHRIGELDAEDARVLTAAFEADYFGTSDTPPRFTVVAVTTGILEEAAALCGRFALRGFDAVQLASALAVKMWEPGLAAMAVFDSSLRLAASASGLPVVPPASAK